MLPVTLIVLVLGAQCVSTTCRCVVVLVVALGSVIGLQGQRAEIQTVNPAAKQLRRRTSIPHADSPHWLDGAALSG